MEKSRWIVSALFLSVAIPSCGSSTAGGGAGGTGGTYGGSGASIPIAEFPAAFVDAACSYMARCGQMPDKATCQAAISPDLPRGVAGANAGKIKYDSKAAAACVDALSSLSCNYWEVVTGGAFESCAQAFKPLVINGGPCFIDGECISGQCTIAACSGGGTCCAGTCVPGAAAAGTVAIGGDCSSGCSPASMSCIDVCIDGAFCDASSISGVPTCQPKAALGQPCSGSPMGSSSCVDGATCTGGICVRTPAEGQTCTPSGGFPECDSSLDYCDDVALKCVRRIPVGGKCSGDNCVDYAACDSTGTCVARGGVGGRCDRGTWDWCLGNLECRLGTCVFPASPAICE